MAAAPTGTRAAELGTRPLGRLLWWSCANTTASVGIYGVYALTNAWFVARMVGGISWIVDDETVTDAQDFLAAHPIPEGRRTVDQHCERQRLHRALREREHERLRAILAG